MSPRRTLFVPRLYRSRQLLYLPRKKENAVNGSRHLPIRLPWVTSYHLTGRISKLPAQTTVIDFYGSRGTFLATMFRSTRRPRNGTSMLRGDKFRSIRERFAPRMSTQLRLLKFREIRLPREESFLSPAILRPTVPVSFQRVFLWSYHSRLDAGPAFHNLYI